MLQKGLDKVTRERGFTILELMIVVTIIAIIAAIAIPSLQNARKTAQATKAIGLLRTTVTVSEQYYVRFGGYASGEANLVSAGLIPDVNSNLTSGYNFNYSSGVGSWSMQADPRVPGVSADLYFYVDQSGVIRFSSTGSATSTSAPID